LRSLVVVLLPEAVGREEGEEEHEASNETSGTNSTEGITELITNWLTAATRWKAFVDVLGEVEEVWGAESRAGVRDLKEFDNLHESVLSISVGVVPESIQDCLIGVEIVLEIIWGCGSIVSARCKRGKRWCEVSKSVGFWDS